MPSARRPWLTADPGHSARAFDLLTVAALVYLALPILIFGAAWLKPAYAAAASLLLLAAMLAALRAGEIRWRPPVPAGTLLAAAVAGFAWAAFGGAGHLLYANSDWIVRDAVLMDLVHAAWPPSYGEHRGDAMILRTALAYFLPAALLGSLVGAQFADLLLYAWTGLGAALFLCLLPLPRKPLRLALALVIVILFSGMDAAGVLLIAGHLPPNALHLEWWAHPLQYSSHTTQLFWVPNHALPAWLGAALFYRHWRTPDFWPLAVLAAALLPLWTPFAALGIAPFLALLAADRLQQGLSLRLPWLLVVATAPLLALQVRYIGLGFEQLGASVPAEVAFSVGNSAAKYVRFAFLEFGLLCLALFALLRHSRGILAVAFLTLAALPLTNLGPSNDIVMRASIPSLAFLAILCFRALEDTADPPAHRAARVLLIAMLTLGAVTPAYEFWRALLRPRWSPAPERTLLDVTGGQMPANYIGRLDRADLKVVFKAPTPVLQRK
ncbi:MAG: hypothetical protein IT513_12100 [Burkholderiales bacterium]|nr:hypothetical protein [Burkholderiales bacterium]